MFGSDVVVGLGDMFGSDVIVEIGFMGATGAVYPGLLD